MFQFVVLADAGALLLAEVAAEELAAGAELLAGAEVLEELELLQPAASMVNPTAAAVATIAFDARKVKTLPCRPHGSGGKRWHLG